MASFAMAIGRVVEMPRRMPVFPADVSRGWRVVRRASVAQCEQQADRGLWARIHDEVTGQLIGYQMLDVYGQRGDFDLESMRTQASISLRELEANAGLLGRSKTRGLSEDRRLARAVPEDAIERAQAKVRVWPLVGAACGDILRVWPREA
jgi:hypothetical protein